MTDDDVAQMRRTLCSVSSAL